MDKTEEQLKEQDKKSIAMFKKAHDARREGRNIPSDLKKYPVLPIEAFEKSPLAKMNEFIKQLEEESNNYNVFTSPLGMKFIERAIVDEIGQFKFGKDGKQIVGGFDPFELEEKEETLEDIKKQLNPDLIAGILALEKR